MTATPNKTSGGIRSMPPLVFNSVVAGTALLLFLSELHRQHTLGVAAAIADRLLRLVLVEVGDDTLQIDAQRRIVQPKLGLAAAA